MIRMISSANFNSSDSKTSFPADSGEPETDEFAALLDGLSFVVPPVIQPPVNSPTNFSLEDAGESSIDLETYEDFSAGATQLLPQFDESVILPETFAQVMPKEFSGTSAEKLFSKITDISEDSANLSEEKTGAESFSIPAQNSIEAPQPTTAASSLAAQFAARREFFAEGKHASKSDGVSETEKLANNSDKLFAQIENIQIEEATNNQDFKIAENQFRPENLNSGEKGEAPNKLPKLFREVSSFLEVAETALKNQPQIAENAAPVSPESANVAAQIEPQIAQMIAMAIKTEKPQILKMRLNPAELGAVEIRIEKDEAGKINAHFNTEKEETRKILTENIAQLRDSLQDSGWQVERVEVSCDSSSFAGNQAREDSSQADENAAHNWLTQTNEMSGQANHKEDLNSEKSNRLLSVRA